MAASPSLQALRELEERLARLERLVMPGAPPPPAGGRPSVLFVTPAFGRFELTDICLAQRAWVCAQLGEWGVDASCVVVANDENLELARAHGFHAVERDNRFLGRRFNDGHELAVKKGYGFSFAIGSDSWIDPVLFRVLASGLPPADTVLCSRYYAVVHPSGSRRITIKVDRGFGVGFLVPRSLLEAAGGRPCGDMLHRGCDTSTMKTLERCSPDMRLAFQEFHPLEYVAFQSGRTQITSFEKLKQRHRGMQTSVGMAFDGLEDHYPGFLLKRARNYYATGAALAA